MQILKVIARLLDYPVEELRQYRADLALAIGSAREIPPELRAALLDTLEALCAGDLLDAQEAYGLLFDRGRSLSLHLFEHVHGESRDRGQAMVDLLEVYRRNGFELAAPELPDYLPLFLEYLAGRPELEAREWLADVAHILGRVAARLEERGPQGRRYAVLLEALLVIAGASDQLADARRALAGERREDHTPEAIDREWEEAAVTFTAADRSCGDRKPAAPDAAAPLRWTESPGRAATVIQPVQLGGSAS